MRYFSHVPVDPNRVDLRQMERLRSFREGILSNALVETYGSPLDFRDKFANQLEIKIRDLQKAEEVGRPLPLDLQFLSPQNRGACREIILNNRLHSGAYRGADWDANS